MAFFVNDLFSFKIMSGFTDSGKFYDPPLTSLFTFKMAGPTGLEPAPSGLTGQRYNRLNYGPLFMNAQLFTTALT